MSPRPDRTARRKSLGGQDVRGAIDSRREPVYHPPEGIRGSPGGFTLTEILVAMGVLAIGAVAALSLFAAAAATHKRAVDRVESAYMAEHVIGLAEAKLRGDADLRDLEVREGTVEAFPGYTYSLDLTDLEPATGLSLEILAEVTIRWSSRGSEREETYRTILLRSLGETDYLGGTGRGARR